MTADEAVKMQNGRSIGGIIVVVDHRFSIVFYFLTYHSQIQMDPNHLRIDPNRLKSIRKDSCVILGENRIPVVALSESNRYHTRVIFPTIYLVVEIMGLRSCPQAKRCWVCFWTFLLSSNHCPSGYSTGRQFLDFLYFSTNQDLECIPQAQCTHAKKQTSPLPSHCHTSLVRCSAIPPQSIVPRTSTLDQT